MALLPADVRFRRARLLTWSRRISVALVWLTLLAVPLVHLAHNSQLDAGPTPSILGAPWSVRVLGIEFLDPLAALSLIFARGIGAHFLGVALLVTLLILLLGRFFCGWLCPYLPILAASNLVRALLARVGVRTYDRSFSRRTNVVLLVLLLGVTALSGIHLAPLFYPPAVLGRSVFHAVFWGGLGTGVLVIVGAFAFDTFVARAGFCRYVCPGGALFSLLATVSPLKIRRTREKCTDCTACDVICNLNQQPMSDAVDTACDRCAKCVAACPTGALSFSLTAPLVQIRKAQSITTAAPANSAGPRASRRRFFAFAASVAMATFVVLRKVRRAAAKPVRLRPPSAAAGDEFLRRCIGCFRCAEVCPPKAIRFDGGTSLVGSALPFIDAQSRACILCMKCTDVCPTDALTPTPPLLTTIQATVRMGSPLLEHDACLTWSQTGVCRMCYYACPYPDSAVRLVGEKMAPVFDAAHCVGCGLCEEACPSFAHAVRIVPRGNP